MNTPATTRVTALPVQPASPVAPAPSAKPDAATPPSLLSLRVLVGLCVVLPLLVYAMVGAYRYQQIRVETDLRLDRALRIAQEHALRIFDTNELVIARVLDNLAPGDAKAIQSLEKTLHAQLATITKNRPQIESIWFYSAQGKPLVSDKVYPIPAGLSVTDRSYFQWHQNGGGGTHVSEVLVGRTTKNKFFSMSQARQTPRGEFDGLVSINLSPDYFQKFHRELAAEEPGLAITMLREDGAILSRWPPAANAPASLAPNSPVLSQIRAGATSGVAHGVSSIDQRERLLAFSKVGDYPVYLGTGMDVQEIRSRWLVEMGRLGAFGLPALVGLLVAAYVAWQRTREALRASQQLQGEIEARGRVEEALLQAQKLEALGRLTGGVAHDFNNALMVISNNIYLLKRKHPALDGPQLDSMGRAVQSATKLTRQLLAFSRRQAMVPEYMRLQDKLPSLQDLLGPVLGSQVALVVDIAPDTHAITVDSAEFELALINLAINARDAMPAGGKLTIAAHNAQGDVPPLLKPPLVVVQARDTGSGIDPALLSKVFEPFFTTKPVGQGTGLGLSQIYGLCQRAGGLATIASSPGQGTTVSLYFPASLGTGNARPAVLPPAHRNLNKTILLVEDNEEVAAALQPVLEAMGCRVVHLNRGAAARSWLQGQLHAANPPGADFPDVLLTDVVMPGDVDGLALAQYARANFPQLKVVLMTGYSEQMDTISRQGFKVLPKPCSADMLVDAIAGDAPGVMDAGSAPAGLA